MREKQRKKKDKKEYVTRKWGQEPSRKFPTLPYPMPVSGA
jgi:hypothetical protein